MLVSWAVPKGPSLDPRDKRLAVRVEDHALDHATFEGRIGDGYGAGTVIVWDTGGYENVTEKDGVRLDAAAAIEAGHIKVVLHGTKLARSLRPDPHEDGRGREELDPGQGRRRGRRPAAPADRDAERVRAQPAGPTRTSSGPR